MADEEHPDEDAQNPDAVGFAEFLEDHPPNSPAAIADLGHFTRITRGGGGSWSLNTPDLQLYCSECGGVRTFGRTSNGADLSPGKAKDLFSVYSCRNCRRSFKTYSLKVRLAEDGAVGAATKVGEEPPFGPPVPSRTISLIGPDRDLFLKGRNAESQGFGIGAYAYYRRVVDNQWKRLLSEIIRVAKRVEAPPDTVKTLEEASSETQFSKAVEMVKDAVPESLRIQGHNPLTLLYGALSDGVHDRSDEECLELATAIRVVLYELADRISTLLKDQAELQSALSRIMARRGEKKA